MTLCPESTTVKESFDFRNVVYGYAYNKHWLWFNKYWTLIIPGESQNYIFSFIIWKDYNCHSWVMQKSTDDFAVSSKMNAIRDAIKAVATK